MPHARKLYSSKSALDPRQKGLCAYCRHRFAGREMSNGRVFEQHRYMYGSHLCIPGRS
jgi:hypothetical protein